MTFMCANSEQAVHCTQGYYKFTLYLVEFTAEAQSEASFYYSVLYHECLLFLLPFLVALGLLCMGRAHQSWACSSCLGKSLCLNKQISKIRTALVQQPQDAFRSRKQDKGKGLIGVPLLNGT